MSCVLLSSSSFKRRASIFYGGFLVGCGGNRGTGVARDTGIFHLAGEKIPPGDLLVIVDRHRAIADVARTAQCVGQRAQALFATGRGYRRKSILARRGALAERAVNDSHSADLVTRCIGPAAQWRLARGKKSLARCA